VPPFQALLNELGKRAQAPAKCSWLEIAFLLALRSCEALGLPGLWFKWEEMADLGDLRFWETFPSECGALPGVARRKPFHMQGTSELCFCSKACLSCGGGGDSRSSLKLQDFMLMMVLFNVYGYVAHGRGVGTR